MQPNRCAMSLARATNRSQYGHICTGKERGIAFDPLYKTAPGAAMRDPIFYEYLVLADALRDGRTRERKYAEQELHRRFQEAMRDPNLNQLIAAADALRPLLPELVFAGGCVTGLLITDEAAGEPSADGFVA
jgi:hypothetical protein